MKENKPRRRDPAASRERILNSAEKLFSRKGYSGASMSEIAAKGDVTQSLIHHYFGSKESLFLEVMRRHMVRMGRLGRKRLDESLSGGDFLHDGIKAYFRMLAETPLLVRMGAWFTLFFQQNPRPIRQMEVGDPEEDANQRYVFDLCERMVLATERMQRDGLLRGDISAAALIMLVFSAAEHWHEAKNRITRRLPPQMLKGLDDDTYLDTIVKVVTAGCRPEPSA